MPDLAWLFVLAPAYGLFELVLAWRKRAARVDPRARSADAGSLVHIWLTVGLGIAATAAAMLFLPAWYGPELHAARWLGLSSFCLGIAVRTWAIVALGRLFTVDVAILEGHRLVVTGPYRWLRHPSYSGVMAAVLGLGILSGHLLALACITTTALFALVRRIRVEERALAEAFGPAWEAHRARTWNLVPFLW